MYSLYFEYEVSIYIYCIDYNDYYKLLNKTVLLNKIRNLLFKFHHSILIFSKESNIIFKIYYNIADIIQIIEICSYFNDYILIMEN